MRQLIVFLILVSLLSCNSRKKTNYVKFEKANLTDSVRVKKILLNNDFVKTLNTSRDFFFSEHNTYPKVIVVNLLGKTEKPTIEVETKIDLYTTNREKNQYNDLFFAGCNYNNTVVLLKGEKNYTFFNKEIELTNSEEWFNFSYGGNKSSCTCDFELINQEFIITRKFCPFDLLNR